MNHFPEGKEQFFNDFLSSPLIARLATVDSENHPHVVPVWYGWDGKSIWISSFSNTQKIANLEKNPNGSICIDIAQPENKNTAVIFEGTVELIRQPRDFLEKQFLWIYQRYLGPKGAMEEEPQSWIHDPLNILIKLRPAKIMNWNY